MVVWWSSSLKLTPMWLGEVVITSSSLALSNIVRRDSWAYALADTGLLDYTRPLLTEPVLVLVVQSV